MLMPAGLLHLILDIEPGSNPPRGWLQAPPAPAQPFTSWLELVAALHRHTAQPAGVEGEPSSCCNATGDIKDSTTKHMVHNRAVDDAAGRSPGGIVASPSSQLQVARAAWI
jgi:hypothetical protein